MIRLLITIVVLILAGATAEDSNDTLFLCEDGQFSDGQCRPLQSQEIFALNQLQGQDSFPKRKTYAIRTTFTVNVWVLVPFSNCFVFSKDAVEPAVYQALKDSKATLCSEASSDSKDICYQISFNDTKCNADYALEQVVNIRDGQVLAQQCNAQAYDVQRKLDIFLGMSCDYAASRVSSLAAIWNWPLVFPGSRSPLFDDKSQSCCTTLTRTGHDATDFGRFMYKLYTVNETWNTSYFYYTDNTYHGAPLYYNLYSDCGTILSGVTTLFKSNAFNYGPVQSFESDEYIIENAQDILEELASKTRVSLWCVGRRTMRIIMNTASELGMTSGTDPDYRFAFFYIDLYNGNTTYEWTNEDDYPCGDDQQTSSSSMDGMEALQVLTLYRPETVTFRNFSNAMKAESSDVGDSFTINQEFVSPYVTEYYNAMRLIVNGVKKSIAEDPEHFSNGTHFASKLWNTTFESVDGTVVITEGGDQLMNYVIMDYNSENEKFEESTIYFGINETWVVLKPIDWPGHEQPANIPECGTFVCPALSTTAIIVIVLVVIFVICLIFIAVIARQKIQKEKKLREMTWNVKYDDIVFSRRLGRKTSGTSESIESTSGTESIVSGGYGRQQFADTAELNHQRVAVKEINMNRKVSIDRKLKVEMDQMKSLNNEHICKFIGACIREPVLILTEYCSRGSLQDFLEGDMISKLDDMFRNSLISDIANGMYYLHKSPIGAHGNLKSSNCLLDSRLVVKLTDFGLPSFRERHRRDSTIGYNHYKDLLWTAPELLRLDFDEPFMGTQKGDVYSFAIVVQEILYRMGPFFLGVNTEPLPPDEICRQVQERRDGSFRPTLEDNDDVVVGYSMRAMVSDCWTELPEERLTFGNITSQMKRLNKKQNLFDRMVTRLEQYSSTLEDKVEERTMQYKAEKERADTLLYQMLPKPVADMLKSSREVPPSKYDCVTIYFSDIVGFTAISHQSNAFQVVTMLDDLYTAFDRVVDQHDVYKVETIGDAYMVASGLPEENDGKHVREIARTALELMAEAKSFKIPHMPNETLKIRVGIHSGPVVAGVVGEKMPRYCLFGDTVNTAARMEQSGEGLKIQLSPAAKNLLVNFNTFIIKERKDRVTLKGLGKWKTWWLEGEEGSESAMESEHDSIGALQPTEDNRRMSKDAKKVSHTSDYGSARSSVADFDVIPVTGVGDDNNYPSEIRKADFESRWTPSLQTEMSDDGKQQKRRRTAISIQSVDVSSLAEETLLYFRKQGDRPNISKNVQFHDGYSSLQMPQKSREKKKPTQSSSAANCNQAFDMDEITIL